MSGNENKCRLDDNALIKLIIYSFTDREFNDNSIESSKKTFSTPINPESFTKNYQVEHDVRRGHGNHGTDVRFKSTVPEELRLEFILDGTHTMENYGGNGGSEKEYQKPVHDQLQKLLNCVYDFEGEIHRPRFLMIIWGSEIKFRCVLSNLDINYTLFSPDGCPLRAKITATFLNYKAREERLARDPQSSPDLTHRRKVKQGDRLDLMTYNIYKDPKYFLQVGKVNGLNSIRNLKPGGELYFPPFEKNEI